MCMIELMLLGKGGERKESEISPALPFFFLGERQFCGKSHNLLEIFLGYSSFHCIFWGYYITR